MLNRYRKLIAAVAAALLFVVSDTAAAQIRVRGLTRDVGVLLNSPAEVGLPEDTPINAAMFAGIQLSPLQVHEIGVLARKFYAARQASMAGRPAGLRLTATEKSSMRPQIEIERRAYRALLTPQQRPLFDRNTDAILPGMVELHAQASIGVCRRPTHDPAST